MDNRSKNPLRIAADLQSMARAGRERLVENLCQLLMEARVIYDEMIARANANWRQLRPYRIIVDIRDKTVLLALPSPHAASA